MTLSAQPSTPTSETLPLMDLARELESFVRQAAGDGESFDAVERTTHAQVLEIGRAAIRLFVANQGDGDLGESVATPEGKRLTRSEVPVKRSIRSVFGEITFNAFVYDRGPNTRIELRPVDARMELPAGKYSHFMEDISQHVCVEEAFGQGQGTLLKLIRQNVPVDSLERINRQMGDAAEEFLEQLPVPSRDGEGEILVATADGKGVPLMNPDGTPTAVGGPKPERPGNRKMATLASVYTVDRHFRDAEEVVRALFREQTPEDRRKDRPRAKNKRMTACFPEVQFPGTDDELVVSGSIMAWTWAQEEILRRHQPDQPVVRVCDGQESLWTSSDACLALPVPTVDILDIIHVTQYVWKAGKAFHGDDKGAVEQFVRDRLLRILEGETPSVIRGMRRMMHTRNLKGAARKQVSTVCGYFESNRHRMRYDEYLAAGYPIASGVIEGACRHLVKDRMERTGMRWSLEGAKGMLFVRAIHASELWEEFIAFRRRRDLDRNHPYRELIKDYEPGVAIAI